MTWSARVLVAASCALAACGGEKLEWQEAAPTDEWSDLRLTREVHDGGVFEGEDAALPSIERPGEIDVKIGEAASGETLTPEQAGPVFPLGSTAPEYASGSYVAPPLHLVMDFPYQAWAGEGSWVHLVVLDAEHAPVPSAEVFLDGALVGRTEAHGTFVFRRRPRDEDSGTAGVLTVRHGEHVRSTRFSSFSRTPTFEATTIYAYTDRGVVQPGRTLHLRALAWRLRGEYRALPHHVLSVELADPSGKLVGGGSVRTDEWGVANLDLPIPAHAEEGTYQITVSAGSESARSPVQIRRFVAPVIRIEHDLPRFLTPRVETLPFEVTLAYVDGGRFERGEVALKVRAEGQEVHTASRSVEGAGPHAFVLDAATLERVRSVMRRRRGSSVTVELEVRDALGRVERLLRDLRYETVPYKASIELDKTRYAPGEPVAAMVRLVDLDDVPVRAAQVRLDIPGRRAMRLRTDDGGVALFRFPMPDAEGELSASTDDAEDVARANLPRGAVLPMRSSVEHTVIAEGEPFEVLVRFPRDVVPNEEVVHADVVDSSGAIVDSFLVPVERGGDEPLARATVNATSWGSMLLTLFTVGRRGADVGLLTDGQNLVVQPGQRLEVTLGGLPESAAPGERIDAEVRVVRDGQAREALVGASVVDSAVLALLDPLERAPRDRFYNAERKVLASTGAQTLTWPVVARTWGVERYDIGWPPNFGYHDGRRPPPPRRRGGGYGSGTALGNDPMGALGALMGDSIGENFGFGGLGLTGTGMGGGGTGEGTIGLGNLGTIGHGAGGGTGSGYGRGAGGFRGRRPSTPRAAPTTIVLRTDFAETSLWEPTLVAENGTLRLHAELPDTLTEQTLTVVASDREGGIATARATIPVRQRLQVRAEVPATLGVGDVVEVPVVARNLGDTPVRARLDLRSEALAVEGEAATLDLPANGAVATTFTVHARRAGEASFEASARADDFVDVERRAVRVRPRGEPSVRRAFGTSREGRDVQTEVTVSSERYEVVRLEVTLPNGVPLLQGLDAFEGETDGPASAAHRALGAAAVWRYLEQTGQLNERARAALRVRLDRLALALVSAQNADGGVGNRFARDAGRRSDPYVSVMALEALSALNAIGAMVPESAVLSARDYVLAAADDHGFLDVRSMAAWRGQSELERRALAAQAAHAVVKVRPRRDQHEAMLAWRVLCTAELEQPGTDPRVLGHCTAFLHALDASSYRNLVARAAERLVDLRNLTHFEPQWLDAWAGHVAAVDVALEVLEDVAPRRFERVAPSAARFLLSTRNSWDSAHGGRGTAHALRALARLRPVPEGDGTLEVEVDGEVVERIEVSSEDLWAAALALRARELALAPGTHRVKVRWSGPQEARVELSHLVWDERATRDENAAMTRRLPDELAVGAPTNAVLRLPGEGPRTLRQVLPSGIDVLLEPLRAHPRVEAAWMEDDELVVALGDGAADLTLALVARLAGTVRLPPAELEDAGGSVVARTPEQTLRVQ
ncbi:MAG: hypothetical protein H6721_13135 [Sandaracinus sp.]|nr:hypothetical protein [Sandaracinus sp.]MCB9619054.1 hypothetical protein [Sandaracinus sp.]MCB9633058.1 hypothetical protein [Sandaracinus sp.]